MASNIHKAIGSLLLGVFMLLVIAMPSNAVITYTDLNITVREITTNEIMTSKAVDITFVNVNTGTTINLTDFTDNYGVFYYRINIGNWKLILELDNATTPETDYSGERSFLVEENNPSKEETVYVGPVGAVEGNIMNPEGKLVGSADITVKCKSYKGSSKTDKYGSFKIELVPAGQCTVQAAFDDLIGSSDVNVTQGQKTKTTVYLNKSILSATKKYVYWIIGGVVAIGLIILIYLTTKNKLLAALIRKKSQPAKAKSAKEKAKKKAEKEIAVERISVEEKKEEEGKELNPRARDIIKTLNDKEKKVVDFMLTQEGKKSTQASIRNETGIPKTSLVRVFSSLEAKKVIKIESVGKLKKIEFTPWFLGKE